MFTPAGKNRSNAQDLPSGFCPAGASEPRGRWTALQLPPAGRIWGRRRGQRGGWTAGWCRACFLFSAALTTQSPGHHSCPYHAVLFRAEVGGMGPFGI